MGPVGAIAGGLAGPLLGKLFGGGGSKPDKHLMAQAIATSRQAQGQGSSLFGFGMPLLQQSSNYYKRLLSGDRGALTAAIAPEASMINDAYRGAEHSLERSGVRGAQRDQAEAEIAREKAGKIGGLALAVRPQAAQAVGALGQFGTQGGVSATSGAMTGFQNLLTGDRADRQFAAGQNASFGEAIGGILGDVLKTGASKKGGGG